jgi:hypothetical protein
LLKTVLLDTRTHRDLHYIPYVLSRRLRMLLFTASLYHAHMTKYTFCHSHNTSHTCDLLTKLQVCIKHALATRRIHWCVHTLDECVVSLWRRV